ncbi:unnamed protein product [Adineta steineri]|uniref:Uncharacterized protein n=1 Tax=Adineta steineri TaxID=433720 RepID=A0A815ZMK1_9BILA|nr:unnamed protein product [Adineta steineri]
MSDQAGSTDTSASSDLKAGHAPATKVGGMRVGAPRPRHTSHGEEKEAGDNVEGGQETSGDKAASGANEGQSGSAAAGEGADDEEASAAVANRAAGEMVSGTFVPIQKAFPAEAVKHIHDKPGTHPKHEFHANPRNEAQQYINQPRK